MSNPALQRIDEIKSGNVSKEAIEKLKKQLSDALESINEEVDEIGTRISQNRKDLKEKKEMVEDLKKRPQTVPKRVKTGKAGVTEPSEHTIWKNHSRQHFRRPF